MAISLKLSKRHAIETQSILRENQNEDWSFDLPVLLLDRPWLKLEKLSLAELFFRIPPDFSEELPEIIFYNELIKQGKTLLTAAQECWYEFGMEDFYRALRHRWTVVDCGNNGWTYKKYIALINQYQFNIEKAINKIPLIILAYPDSKENHKLLWIQKDDL